MDETKPEEAPPSSFDLIPDDEVAEIFGDSADPESSDDDLSSILLIAESTEKARKRALAAWNRYRDWVSRKYQKHLDPVEFWTDAVKEDDTAKDHCKKFLRLYVKASKRKRLTLGPEEFVMEQGVKTCRTVNAFWKALIAAADAEYLSSKGLKDDDGHRATLKRKTNFSGWVDQGPVSQITQWIHNEGATLMNLTKESSYDKVEMTGRDTGRLLKTLYECADDIPMQHPIHRVIFHALVLLFTYGGFRRGMVMGAGS